MEKLETIDFQHRGLITDSFKQLNLSISDYTFANVYLFRNISHYEFMTMIVDYLFPDRINKGRATQCP